MIDCNKTKNYLDELSRMCDSYDNCTDCPAFKPCYNCLLDVKTKGYSNKKAIEIIQKWSDEHPIKTLLADFKEKNPNYKKGYADCPTFCPFQIGYEEYMWCINGAVNCTECWNRPLDEVVE